MQMPLIWTPATRTVTELTQEIREKLQGNFSGIWVSGELTECKLASSGHWYFSLKDAGARLSCVCYRGSAFRLKVKPQDGLAVQARGSIDVYEPRGVYQFIVEALEPQGLGALQLANTSIGKSTCSRLFMSKYTTPVPLPLPPMRVMVTASVSVALLRPV